MSALKGFWSTLPGVLTAAAGLIAATSGLIAALNNLGWIGEKKAVAVGKPTTPETAGVARTLPADVSAATRLSGAWEAEVSYDWGVTVRERIVVEVLPDGRVRGSASFLGVPRAIVSGKASATDIEFVTETEELLGSERRTVRHAYQLTGQDRGMDVVMQTTGAAQPHLPLRFSATRALH